MGRIKTPALLRTPAPEAKRYSGAGIAEANAYFKLDISTTCLDQGRQKAKHGIGMQAAGRRHKMEVWRFLWQRGMIEALETGNGGDLDRSKSPSLPLRNCRGTRPVGEVLVDVFWNMTLWALDRRCLFR